MACASDTNTGLNTGVLSMSVPDGEASTKTCNRSRRGSIKTLLARTAACTSFLFPLLLTSHAGTAIGATGEAGLTALAAQGALSTALDGKDWNTALQLARTLPAAEVVSQASTSAEAGQVVGMWVLALGYAREGLHVEGAQWLYRGWLGMRLDTALCLDQRTTDSIEWLLLHDNRAEVDAIGNDARARSDGIRKAALFYTQTPVYPDPGWSCAWAMREHFVTAAPVMLASESRWRYLREAVLRDFYRRTGLGTTQMREDAKPAQSLDLPGIGNGS